METYDLALRLLSLQSSSTAAIAQTVKGILKRLDKMLNAEEEIAQLQTILDACQSIPTDTKAKELLKDFISHLDTFHYKQPLGSGDKEYHISYWRRYGSRLGVNDAGREQLRPDNLRFGR